MLFVTVLLLIFFPLLPESPHYLVMRGEFEKAEIVLAKMARINNTRLPPGRLAATIPNNPQKKLEAKKPMGSRAHGILSGAMSGMKT